MRKLYFVKEKKDTALQISTRSLSVTRVSGDAMNM